jgi:hypothetical protein
MTALPTKYVPIDYSLVGVASLLLEFAMPNDTVSSLWDRLRGNQKIRTFDRFADALTLLFTANVIYLQDGVIRRVL